ncbi:MAG: BrnA antitoxin family protein [Alcanivoracaceae bacterium]|jgi:uncharacterized protein (DUF4415 family)|nr:BrnA antitoxin family protein [Alcanivoracaceae bacterium]
MAKPTRQRPTRADRDNPEWSHEDFRRASPAADVLPGLVGEQAAGELLKPKRGRPPADNPRRLISLRLPEEVIAKWRATGPGWQTRMAEHLATGPRT